MAKRASSYLQKGFTIVELLIVVVVIAILAAITIVAYNGIQNRAKQSAAQSATRQALGKIQAFAVQNAETYPDSIAAAGISEAGNTTYQYRSNNTVSPRSFCLTATTQNVSYYVSSIQPAITAGACNGHAVNGGTVITNLVENPNAEGTYTNGWTAFGGASVATSTDWSSSGSRSFRLTTSSTADQGDFRINNAAAVLEPGKTYTMSARVYIPVALTGNYNRSPRVLFWYATDPGGTSYVAAFGPKTPITTGTHTASHTFTVPANTTSVYLGLGGASSTSGQSVYYDSVMLTEGSAVHTFADGDVAGWRWNVNPNNSTSTGPPLSP